jgi:hypothetical protein
MRLCQVVVFSLLMVLSTQGCRAKVEPTADSIKVEAEVPTVEVKKTPDLDPRTDDDVDIKTPAADDK